MSRKRKIIASIAVSADGFIGRADGSVDWLDRPEPKGGYGMAEFYGTIDTILWGRKTYELALDFQKKGVPGSAFDPRVKNYVFSRTLKKSAAPPAVEFINQSVRAFTARLRGTSGKNIWMMGGAGMIASFLDQGEIDEFILHVIPTFIGEGVPLIGARRRTVELKLLECRQFADGVVCLHYEVRKQKAAKQKKTNKN